MIIENPTQNHNTIKQIRTTWIHSQNWAVGGDGGKINLININKHCKIVNRYSTD